MNAKFNVKPEYFIKCIMDKITIDEIEIGFGFNEPIMNTSKKELDKRSIAMKSRM